MPVKQTIDCSYNYMMQSIKGFYILLRIHGWMVDETITEVSWQLGAECVRMMDYDVHYTECY